MFKMCIRDRWISNNVGGLGWIAVALVIFASWKPVNAIYGSMIFGALRVLKYYVPKTTYNIPDVYKRQERNRDGHSGKWKGESDS